MATAILSVNVIKCPHFGGIYRLGSYANTLAMWSIWMQYHPPPGKGTTVQITGQEKEDKRGMALSSELTVGDIVAFNIKYLSFECQYDQDLEEFKAVVNDTTKKAANAFELLMAKGRALPDTKKPSSEEAKLNRKDELYNDLIRLFKDRGLDFPKHTVKTDGTYTVQVVCNCLWYLTNQHTTINDTASRQKDVLPIPTAFDDFQGYNDVKRKKLKSMPLDVTSLESHSNTLYSILMKPVMNSSEAWQSAAKDIRELADCLKAYRDYLIEQNKTAKHNQSLTHPVRTISEDATIEHRKPCHEMSLREEYKILDTAVRACGIGSPLVFDENIHVNAPFESNNKRYTFVRNMHLSVPIDIIRFSPGGSTVTTLCISQVPSERSEADILVHGAQLLQKVRPKLIEKHSRAQRNIFKAKLSSLANISPAVSDFIYKELTMDGAAAAHPITQERLRLISLGHTGLIVDLRHLNPGRPNNKFDTFFEAMTGVVENVTAADDRRHGEAHLSEFISLDEMIEKTKSACPEGTPIPSKSLVRLQFIPRNPYSHVALNFTSRLKVQYKIQRRQLRVSHIDSHFCNAQFRYMKERAVELTGEKCVLVFSDDKAKVPIGEPGSAVSTGVRGRTSIVPTGTTLVALDHDMTKSSLTPSVVLKCNIPDSIDKSFVHGTVTTAVNDSIFQGSNPFRHIAMLAKILNSDAPPPILMRFTDGGTDQRTNLESVRCANICLFKEFNFDMVLHLRCAPGQSWTNPAERVMSILNIGLQNVSLERKEGDKATETELKKCGSMAEIRTKEELKQQWLALVEPVQSINRNRFSRLKLKGEPIGVMDPVPEESIDILKRHLRELFPGLDLNKLQKSTTKKNLPYQEWVKKHCKLTQYAYQIRKCKDESCCLPPFLAEEELFWLPDPVLDKEDGNHYLRYTQVKGLETSEIDRPSLIESKKKNVKQSLPTKKINSITTQESSHTGTPVQTDLHTEETRDFEVENISLPDFDASICKVQNARLVAVCVDCEKPRVIFSKHKLTDRQQMSLTMAMSEYEYTCGSAILPPSNAMYRKVTCRMGITCETPIQLPFYSSGLGKSDLCCHCASDDGEVDTDLKKRYKTVLPICLECKQKGKSSVVQRPYGKETA